MSHDPSCELGRSYAGFMSARRWARAVATATVAVAVLAGTAAVPDPPTTAFDGRTTSAVAGARLRDVQVTFRVRVPGNTPAGTRVYVETLEQQGARAGRTDPLTRLAKGLYGATLSMAPGSLHYRYMRNNWGFTAAEEFTPDAASGHRTAVVAGGTTRIADRVAKWRWLPGSGGTTPAVPSAAGSATFLPRDSGRVFQKGMLFSDFWWGNFAGLLATTNAAMRRDQVRWVEIAPTWDYATSDPPSMTNIGFGHTYPDADLIAHITATRKAGFKVYLAPQVCCADLSKVDMSARWWNTWFEQYERYSLYFADVAARTGVDQLAISGDWLAIDRKPAGYAARLEAIYAKVGQRYGGPVGRSIYLGGLDGAAEPVWPPAADMPGMGTWDFFAVNWWAGLSPDPGAAQPELSASALRIMNASLAPLAAQYGKPVVLSQIAYPSVVGGVTGRIDGESPGLQMWNDYDDTMVLDLVGQARAFEAVLTAVAQSPYVTGTYPFVYWPDEFPLSKEYNIRGKPAAAVVRAWYASIG